MSVYTAVPVHLPPAYEQRVLTLPSRNLSQPVQSVTPLHYLGNGPALKQITPHPVETKLPPKPATTPVPPPPSKPKLMPATVASGAPAPTGSTGNMPKPTTPRPKMQVEADKNPVDTVFFPVSKDLVPDQYIRRLTQFPVDGCYLVVGHSDPTGTPQLILGLSLNRAAAVATVMRSAGLRVDVSGMGDYGVSHKPADYPKDRRAEIWTHACPGNPVPAAPKPPPETPDGSVSVQVAPLPGGGWQTVIVRQFETQAAAQAWAVNMQHEPPMQAHLGGGDGIPDAVLGFSATVGMGFQAMAHDLERMMNRSAAMMSASISDGVRQWLQGTPMGLPGGWRAAFASIGSPIGTAVTTTVKPALWAQ